MPDRSGYQPLPQLVDEEDVAESALQTPRPQTPTIPNTRPGRRGSRPTHIDLRKLDSAFKRWTESIAQKVKRKKKVEDDSKKEIVTSVFEPYEPPNSAIAAIVKTLDHKAPMTHADFDQLVQSVKQAISEGIHPKMITKGSSGSYFARAKVEGHVRTVAVFKPKDEEPYGRLNPKTTKWLHRQFRWIIPFGRACLIPNLSYISEAAASLLDQRLDLHMVPRTELVSLSSPAYFYDWIDRTAAKKGKPLPEKIGSMQYFLHGYSDASDFLRKHPWPGRAIADTFDDDTHRRGSLTKRCLSTLKIVCGRTGDEDDLYEDEVEEREDERVLFDPTESTSSNRGFYWSQALQQNFREELEKLVILDYLMRNTDRGADNYMIKYCEGVHEKSLVDVAPSRSSRSAMPQMSELRANASTPTTPRATPSLSRASSFTTTGGPSYTKQPHIHIAAIDNSLSFPWEHPHGWRSYTYGWLYLPVSIIGKPFSEKTRNHFLPLLTSKEWWEETTYQLRKIFAVDPDFNLKMFRRQLAVVKGQAWNIVQSLRHSDEGPLELTRRQIVLVWDDELEMDEVDEELFDGPRSAGAESINSMPLLQGGRNRRTRSYGESDFAPSMRRTSSEATSAPRPVPFSVKYQRVHPGTTGVTVLEHMERLDAVEAGLTRLGTEDNVIEEEDVGESATPKPKPKPQPSSAAPEREPERPSEHATTSFSAVRSEDPPDEPEFEDGVTDEDTFNLSKSTPQLETWGGHSRWRSNGEHHGSRRRERQSFDWARNEPGSPGPKKRTVVVERLETIETKPFFSFW